MIAELDDFPLGVRDFLYLNDRGWLIVALSDMKLASRLDSYLTNTSMPWEKKKDEATTFASVGALLYYQVGVDPVSKNWTFYRKWAKNFSSQTNILEWSPEQKYTFVGLDSGKISLFKMNDNNLGMVEATNTNGVPLDMKVHTKRVMGISYDNSTGFIYSIGEDGFFKMTDATSGEVTHEEQLSTCGLKVMIHDKENSRFFIGDGEGHIIVMSNEEVNPPVSIVKLQSSSKACIRDISLD